MRAGWLALLALCVPMMALAWGPTGHRVVARIAENHLSPTARAAVAKLAGPAGLAPIATWADAIRSDPRYVGGVAGEPDTRSWHYINLKTIAEMPSDASAPRDRHGIRDLIGAIRYFEAALADGKAPEAARAEALRWLVHLYGDLHQPLHVGLAADKGGNMVDVDWFGERTNLHRVWDSSIIDHARLSFTEWVQFIDHASPDAIEQAQAGDLRSWAAEAIAMRPAIYDWMASGPAPDARPPLAYAYADRHRPVVEERLRTAGLRLAARLDVLLGR